MIMIIGRENHTGSPPPERKDSPSSSLRIPSRPQAYAATSIATRTRGILGLRVHTHGRSAHAEPRPDPRVRVERRMCMLDRFKEGQVAQRQNGACPAAVAPVHYLVRVGGREEAGVRPVRALRRVERLCIPELLLLFVA
jgi:hypothetical protein